MKKITEFILFALIFCVYFSSSVGLMNSGDAPQYFTTEALIRNGNLDMSAFSGDPHYFVWPDYFIFKGQVLSMRGYMLSVITWPVHIVAGAVNELFTTAVLSSHVPVTGNTPYELAITSLFVLFSVAGLMFLYAVCMRLTERDTAVSVITVLLFALGTYIWKYAAFYTRQGLMVAFLGFSMYALCRCEEKEGRGRWITVFLILWAITFGIDVLMFAVMTGFILTVAFVSVVRKNMQFLRSALPGVLAAVFFIGLNIVLNFYYYGTPLFSNYEKNIVMQDSVKNLPFTFWFSTPLFPTIFSTLFGLGKIPASSFSNFDSIPETVQTFVSLAYAKRYVFYGIMAISPFLYSSLLYIGSIRKSRWNYLLSYCMFMFCGGVLLTTKYFGFWGGNQYDVRYFYPFVLVLGPVAALGIKKIFLMTGYKRLFSVALLGIAGIWSIWMGWLGVINMFKPALSGERRIWIEVFTFLQEFRGHALGEYVDAAFMNRENVWIALLLSLFVYTGYLAFSSFFSKHKRGRHISHLPHSHGKRRKLHSG